MATRVMATFRLMPMQLENWSAETFQGYTITVLSCLRSPPLVRKFCRGLPPTHQPLLCHWNQPLLARNFYRWPASTHRSLKISQISKKILPQSRATNHKMSLNQPRLFKFKGKGSCQLLNQMIPQLATLHVTSSTLERAKDRLFPTGLSLASATNAVNAAWKRSTIFGPL